MCPSWAWIVTSVRSARREAFLTTLAISSRSSFSGSVRRPALSPTTKRRPKKLSDSPAAGGAALDLGHRLTELVEALARHDIGRAEAQGVEPRPGGHVAARAAGAGMVREGRGDRDQRDPPLGRVEKPRFARLREALPDTRLHQPGRGHVLRREVHAQRTEVAGMVVGPRDHVETRPGKLFHQRRLGAHVGAAALVHRVGLVIVEEHLEVRERGVCPANDLEQPRVGRFVEHGDGPGDDGVAGQRQRQRRRVLGPRGADRERRRENDERGPTQGVFHRRTSREPDHGPPHRVPSASAPSRARVEPP